MVTTQSLWVSGSRGFVGRHLVGSLREAGHSVTCVSLTGSADGSVAKVDFSDPREIRRAVDRHGAPKVFLHLGWGDVYQPQADVHLASNVTNSRNLIDELYGCGLCRFILLGSASEYGDRMGCLSEDMEGEGKLTQYVKGKREVSLYGFEVAQRLERVFVHIRLFHTFGAGQHHNSLINQLYRNAESGTEMQLTSCEHYRDYVYVSDVAEGIRRISAVEKSTTVNLGSGEAVMLREFVKQFWSKLGRNPARLKFGSRERPDDEPTQPLCYADLSRLQELTGWKPSIDLSDGITRTIEMLRSPGDAPRS